MLLFGPRGRRRGAQGFGAARKRLRNLTSRSCLSAAPAGRVASSARAPKSEHRRAVRCKRTAEVGVAFSWFLLLAKQKKELARRGETRLLTSRHGPSTEPMSRAFDKLSPNGLWCRLDPSTGSARTGWRMPALRYLRGCRQNVDLHERKYEWAVYCS